MITFKARTSNGEIINSALSGFAFPAGEKHIKREEQRELEPVEIAVAQIEPDTMHDDLFQLAMWNNYLKLENADTPPEGPSKRVLVIPYFPGARADRGQPFGLGVYAQFIRDLDLDQILIYDPHSGMTGDTLHAAADVMTYVYPSDILNTRASKIVMPNVYDGIIAPDRGAHSRAVGTADAFDLPTYTAVKQRDFETGKLSGFSIDLPETGHFLIVDDICDGGGTFLGLAGVVPEGVKLDLYVSHGVFSKNALANLGNTFNRIFTTNSYAPWRPLVLGDPGHFDDSVDSPFRRIDIIRPLLDRISV